MAVSVPGLSSLGIRFGYGVETTVGECPAAFTWLERCNNIAGIALSTETIDASALEDYVTRKVAGRQDAGDTWAVTFNYTEEVEQQLKDMIAAYNTGKPSGLRTWFEVWIPNSNEAFFVIAEPPQKLAMPEFGQNALLTIEVQFAIQEYHGTDVAIEPVG